MLCNLSSLSAFKAFLEERQKDALFSKIKVSYLVSNDKKEYFQYPESPRIAYWIYSTQIQNLAPSVADAMHEILTLSIFSISFIRLMCVQGA